MSINRRTQILWCKELKFLDGTPNLPAEAQKEFIVRKPYFKHNSKNAFKFNSINQNINQLPRPTATHTDLKNSTTNTTSKKDDPGMLIALASFPGSGNTWLRYLLQQATGLYIIYLPTRMRNKIHIFFKRYFNWKYLQGLWVTEKWISC